MNSTIGGILSIVFGYLVGSLLPAYFIAKAKGKNIQEMGTGNPGVANAADTMGYTVGAGVALFDLVKAPLAILFSVRMGNSQIVAYLSGFAAVLGHIFPFCLHFQGGQGLAAAVGIGFFSLFQLLKMDWHFAYFAVPVFFVVGVVFFIEMKEKPAKGLILVFVPVFLMATLFFYGMRVDSVVLFIVGVFIIGHRIAKMLSCKIGEMSAEERHLLKRKWLRPFAVLFPVGIFFYRNFTLILLSAVFFFFVVLEIIRFKTKRQWFPLPYKHGERTRISSILMFLFSTLLILYFFPAPVASLSILFVIFGDLLAWCIGISVGGRGFLKKTWSGTLACLSTCTILAIIYDALGLVSLPVGLLGSVSATALEVTPIQEDNFVMPVASAIVMAMFRG